MACLGPIVCRVVTCTPPWLLDPTCGTSARVDDATRNHDRPCLDQPFGAVDHVADIGAAIEVAGWAISPSDQSATDVRVYVDGRLAGEQLSNDPRPDVGAAFPAFGSARGYDIKIAAAPGHHLVCVYALSDVTGFGTFLGLANISVMGIVGSLDVVQPLGGGRVTVAGWAIDPTIETGAATVEIEVDGTPIGRFPASLARTDVGASYPTAGPNHGFDQVVQVAQVAPGSHQFCATVIGTNGTVSQVGCRTVVVT